MSSMQKQTRHVLGISGGKDSAALAIYLKDQGKIDNIEYFFSDTGCELPEVYEFIDKLEDFLGTEIKKIGSDKPFEHHLVMHGNYLPSQMQRWCTREMKIKPFEQFVGNDEVVSYIGIRADEDREGYISKLPNINPVFPFKEDGIVRKDVFQILENTVGIPEYYKWRSRSGCYFCFFQRRDEWLGLYKHHNEFFEKAVEIEETCSKSSNEKFTWIQGKSLQELLEEATKLSGGIDEAIEKGRARNRQLSSPKNKSWQDVLAEDMVDEDPADQACLICSL